MGALRHFSDRNNDEMESYKLTSKWIDKLNEENDTHLKRYKILESQKNIVIHNMEG